MATFVNPALVAFTAQLKDELLLAEVFIRRGGAGYELRHVNDRDSATDSLRLLPLSEVRALAQFTAENAFRPLKAAPTLRAGWRLFVTDDDALESALELLYPGAIADWFAGQSAQPPVTDYREFTARQSGMYRITTMLTDAQAANVASECCDASRCLKRRLWTVPGLSPDCVDAKSIIPCLEPCAVLLESARVAVRLEQAGDTQ